MQKMAWLPCNIYCQEGNKTGWCERIWQGVSLDRLVGKAMLKVGASSWSQQDKNAPVREDLGVAPASVLRWCEVWSVWQKAGCVAEGQWASRL